MPSNRTNLNNAPVIGSAQSLPAQFKSIMDYMTWQVQQNPNYKLPDGFHVDSKSGKVVENQPGFLLSHPWAIPALALAIGATAGLASGAFAAAPSLAGLGSTVPAGSAIAPSVDIGADALAGGLTSTIPTVGTFAGGLGTAAEADAASLGTGAADAGAPGFVGSSISDTSNLATLTDPSVANVPTSEGLATTPEWTGTSAPASSVLPTTAAGTSSGLSNFLKSLAGPLVSGGLGLAGAAIQSNAANKAAEIAAQTAANAANVSAQEYNTNVSQNTAQANQKLAGYNQTMADLAPYRAIGTSALNALGQGLPGFTTQQTPTVTPIAPLATPNPISVPGQTITPTSFQPGATVGERRYVNGQLAQWDGTGWEAV